MASPSTFFLTLCFFFSIFTFISHSSHALGSFTFNIHHLYSDAVRQILPLDALPQEGTLDYYAAMVRTDHFVHSRRLVQDQPPLTFFSGNQTLRINPLGFLYYAEVTVGTPEASYLVALDTGSDLFWLPCDCVNCITGFNTSQGPVNFNIYSPSNSSTSKEVQCSSSLCAHADQCSSRSDTCPYEVSYLSDNTSSTGYLVEDILHLTTNDDQSKPVNAKITLGCGKDQSGAFLSSAAPNGLFGLGIENVSVPSILANAGLISNSFSLCFGPARMGRIEFGDKGSPGQSETPFNLGRKHPTYNISITQIGVGGHVSNVDVAAIFDSGTSFTYLNDPAYSVFADKFDSMIEEKRYTMSSGLPFENCYELSPNQTTFTYPVMNLTMKGGGHFVINHPVVLISTRLTTLFCLAIARSDSINIIGQNFMTGYHIVFDREKMVLGWKESNCTGYEDENTNNLPVGPTPAPAAAPRSTIINPQANSNINNTSQSIEKPKPTNSSSNLLTSVILTFLMSVGPFLLFV
ncbi:aspartyl protease family protein 1 [Benincasa hispida]|uniref:aspartyl protease family protein 1 n=1 Tax=Benincasa hispida TaxID=102211 RepID=UPI0019002D65|nr:aspartyl protease family protein 1 [Benincasa hispida]